MSRCSTPESYRTARSRSVSPLALPPPALPARGAPGSPHASSDTLSAASTAEAPPSPCARPKSRRLGRSGKTVRTARRYRAATVLQAAWRACVPRRAMALTCRLRWLSFFVARAYVRLRLANGFDAQGNLTYNCDACGKQTFASRDAVRSMGCNHGLVIVRCEPCCALSSRRGARARPPPPASTALRVSRPERHSHLVPRPVSDAKRLVRLDDAEAPLCARLLNGDVAYSCLECGLVGSMSQALHASLRARGCAPARCTACDLRARGIARGTEPELVAGRAKLVRMATRQAATDRAMRVRVRAHHAVAGVAARRLGVVWRAWVGWRLARRAAQRRWCVLGAVVRLAFARRRPPRMRRPSADEAPPPPVARGGSGALRVDAPPFIPVSRYQHALLLLFEREQLAMKQVMEWQMRAFQAEAQLGQPPPAPWPEPARFLSETEAERVWPRLGAPRSG